jgi:putative FmdB family regulatory protein
MPTYEYQCGKCEREFEVEQRITDDPIKTCPHCRSRQVKKLISRTSFVLKGSGWYSDLYSSAKPADKSEGGAESSSSGESAESKPSDKADKGSGGDDKGEGGDSKGKARSDGKGKGGDGKGKGGDGKGKGGDGKGKGGDKGTGKAKAA